MGVSSNVWASCRMILLAAVIQGCNNLPQSGQDSGRAAAPNSSPVSAGSRSGSAAASSQQGSPSSPSASSSTAPTQPSQSTGTAGALEAPPQSPLQIQLKEGIRLFDQGEFYSAIGKLRGLPNIQSASVDTQITAIKYLAFSYCVTKRQTMCQQQFETAFRLNPNFELAPAERGHPIWKIYYERARGATHKAPPPVPSKKQDKLQDRKVDVKAASANPEKAGAGAAKPSAPAASAVAEGGNPADKPLNKPKPATRSGSKKAGSAKAAEKPAADATTPDSDKLYK